MMVRFATLCDHPGCEAGPNKQRARSDEYTSFPSCRMCFADVCPEHMAAGSYRESDGRETCVCITCDYLDRIPEADPRD